MHGKEIRVKKKESKTQLQSKIISRCRRHTQSPSLHFLILLSAPEVDWQEFHNISLVLSLPLGLSQWETPGGDQRAGEWGWGTYSPSSLPARAPQICFISSPAGWPSSGSCNYTLPLPSCCGAPAIAPAFTGYLYLAHTSWSSHKFFSGTWVQYQKGRWNHLIRWRGSKTREWWVLSSSSALSLYKSYLWSTCF